MRFYFLILFGLLYTTVSIAQNTLIPDPNFEQRLIDMGYDSGAIDGVVLTNNINSITDLWIPNSSIIDLSGIEDFLALELLDITGNGISLLNMTNNLNLRELYAETNPIVYLDLSNNTSLEILRIGYMQLTQLDVSNNLALTTLSCNNNQLCSLDVSINTNISSLNCANNNLTYLNVNNGTNSLLTTMNALNNYSSMCVQVDDETAANANSGVYSSWQTEGSISYSGSCSFGPEFNLTGNSISISSGDTTPDGNDNTDFGIIPFGTFLDHEFSIENSGDTDLNLLGDPLIEITGSTDFTISDLPDPIISSSGSSLFSLRYTPSMAGTINIATIRIITDDCDRDPFIFNVKGQSSGTLSITNNELKNDLKLVPNPSAGLVSLLYSGKEIIEKISIYDVTGKRVRLMTVNMFTLQYNMDLRNLKGIYFLYVSTKNGQAYKKLVII